MGRNRALSSGEAQGGLFQSAHGGRACVRRRLEHIRPMKRPSKVEALPGFRLRIAYPDGVAGVIDLSADVGRGVFAPLADVAFFRTVHVGRHGQISWSEDLEICPDAAYDDIAAGMATGAAHA